MTYTYTETTTRTASIHTSPARQQFLAVGGGRERPLSRLSLAELARREQEFKRQTAQAHSERVFWK
jgi:hypothetical protein